MEERSMRMGVVGSRTFTDTEQMEATLNEWLTWCHEVVSGGAIGADSMAEEWAKRHGYSEDEIVKHLPDKERYGWPRAAFERNTLIVNDSDVLLAFFGPGEPPIKGDRHFGSGTMDTVTKAIAKRIPVHLYFQEETA
jgi:hypothetical protein